MISFNADPRTRLVVCAVILAAATLVFAPLLGVWMLGFMFAVPMILGYFAARMDWPLFATGIALTPWLIVAISLLAGEGGDAAGDESLFVVTLLPLAAVILLGGSAVGAWLGDRTHGGDWQGAAPDSSVIIRTGIGGLILLVLVVGADVLACAGSGTFRGVDCGRAPVVVAAGGAVIGAILLRSWVWAAMATAAVAIAGVVASLGGGSMATIPGSPGLAVSLFAVTSGLIALAALAWVRLAIEGAQLLRGQRYGDAG